MAPHLDDAALSCDALLVRDDPTEVLTVFAGSPEPPQRGFWDERCGFRDSSESMPARRREEETALRASAAGLTFLDLLEAQYVDRRTAAEAEAVATAVAEWVTAAGEAPTVAAPAGAGWAPRFLPRPLVRRLGGRRGPEPHPDHVFVRDALLGSLGAQVRIVLFEELPYLFAGRADGSVTRAAARNGYEASERTAPVDRERKARRLAAYESQIPYLTGGRRLDDPRALPETERYWLLERLRRPRRLRPWRRPG